MAYPFSYIYKPSLKSPVSKAGSFNSVPKKTFDEVVQIVIDNFEGGYFHRKMLEDGRVKDPKGLFSAGEGRVDSGETMFGLDRVNGKQETTKAGKDFWKLIDNSGASKNWQYNYMGGDLAPQLKKKTTEIMQPLYKANTKKYLSPASKKIVDSDPRLLIHFVYATWNGSGFFKNFAKTFNEAVDTKGIKNPNVLSDIAIQHRKNYPTKSGKPNVLLAKTAEKMEKLFTSLK